MVGGAIRLSNGLRWIWVQRDEYQTAHFAAVIARLDPKSGMPDFGTYQNDRNRKHPILIGDQVNTDRWILVCPVKPGNDTCKVNLIEKCRSRAIRFARLSASRHLCQSSPARPRAAPASCRPAVKMRGCGCVIAVRFSTITRMSP